MASQTQSILRNGINSRSNVTSSARSILKRPSPLPLSPAAQSRGFLQVGQFHALMSPPPAKVTPRSPHVRFPPSPSKLVATFTVYSPTSYDRGPISVSPNPLLMPGWGERVYSPSSDAFKLSPNVRQYRTLQYNSPVITEFEDPRSPKLQPPAKTKDSKASTAIRFASIASSIQSVTQPKARTIYPRSPCPVEPVSQADVERDEMDARGRQAARSGVLPSPAERNRAREQSVQERKGRNKKGLTLGPRVADSLGNNYSNTTATNTPSPLGRSVFSPAVSSLNRAKKPAPLAMDALITEFWNALTLAPQDPSSANTVDEPMVTALEYPESAVEYDEKLDMTLRAAEQPPLLYAGADGVVWAPQQPLPSAAVDKIRESLMSPGVGKSFGRASQIVRRDFTAPSPNDPWASFPTFAAAMEEGGVQYPARVAQCA